MIDWSLILALKVQAAAKTDIGLVRRSNQDKFGADERLGVWLVCDGMGGAAGGEVASSIAVESFLSVVRQELATASANNGESTCIAMRRAAAAANRAVLERAAWDICYRGMGSTLVAVRIVDESLTVIHVGDSRAYLFRDGSAVQLTQDHSWVAEQVRRGVMAQAEAEGSSLRSVITRAIGAEADLRPDLSEAKLQAGDTLLLASDGLTNHVTGEELAERFSQNVARTAEQQCQELVELALARGGSDNITCIVLQVTPTE